MRLHVLRWSFLYSGLKFLIMSVPNVAKISERRFQIMLPEEMAKSASVNSSCLRHCTYFIKSQLA